MRVGVDVLAGHYRVAGTEGEGGGYGIPHRNGLGIGERIAIGILDRPVARDNHRAQTGTRACSGTFPIGNIDGGAPTDDIGRNTSYGRIRIIVAHGVRSNGHAGRPGGTQIDAITVGVGATGADHVELEGQYPIDANGIVGSRRRATAFVEEGGKASMLSITATVRVGRAVEDDGQIRQICGIGCSQPTELENTAVRRHGA